MTRPKHECPEDVGQFFEQLFHVIARQPETPDVYEECRICGGLIDMRPGEPGRALTETGKGEP